jgi:protein O-GlcNAc transferase
MSKYADRLPDAFRLLASGKLDEAEAIGRELIAADWKNAAAWELLGLIERARGKYSESLECITKATNFAPQSAELRMRRGMILRLMPDKRMEAVAEFRQAVGLDPNLAEAHHQLGNALKSVGKNCEALPSLVQASKLAPSRAVVWLNLGVVQLELEDRENAIASFRKAIALEPSRPEAHNILGSALLDDGQIAAGEVALRTALRLRPEYAAAHHNLGRAYRAQARISEAIAEYRAALRVKPDAGTHSNLLYALNLEAGLSPDDVFAEHIEWARQYAGPLSASIQPLPNDRSPERRLRVGFVSPDFVNHAVAYFFEPLLTNRDRMRCEVFCYSDAAAPDRVTERLRRSSDHWRETAALTDEQLEETIRRDQIDVLVDLTGHTAHNRLLVFARKPAPVQITWLGYPNTTGLRTVDYRITDAVSDPAGETDKWHSEELWRTPRAFLSYLPPVESPGVAELPALKAGHVTFASFSNYAKVSRPCIETWARVLNRVPHSHLLLKSRGLADEALGARVRAEFEQLGVAPERIELDAHLVSVADHLKGYGRVDVALDPFPYNGTTTTCEALWMGVPVVTLAGRTHAARVGVSLLTHLGRAEWIAQSTDEYVERAVALTTNLPGLSAIRSGLRAQMAASALCDATGFARDMADAFRDMWRRYCAQ